MRAALALLLAASVALQPAAAASRQANLIVVEKAKREMTLYTGRKAIKTYRIALGGSPVGAKEQEGDSRTPEGRYTIDAKNPQSSFHLSLHISYPTRQQTVAARKRGVSPGGAIMIHGTPEGIALIQETGLLPDWTAGCIAVTNGDIDEIFKMVKVGTPIVIKP